MSYTSNGGYKSWDEYHANCDIRTCVNQLNSGFFDNMGGEFRVLFDSLMIYNDEFFVLRDFHSYLEMHDKLQTLHLNQKDWNAMSLVNIANSGRFSSDRTIREYADWIWKVRYRTIN